MSTDAQIKANRENAKRSTGPATAEGKAASARNRFQHGFCGVFRILHFEIAANYEALLNALRDEHRPATPTEQILVDRMAQHHWLAQRAEFLQSSLFSEVHLDDHRQKLLTLYMRYQTSNERAFSKCFSDLQKLRADKRKAEIGFEREKQRAAGELRKQEVHETRTRTATAKAEDSAFNLQVAQFIRTCFTSRTKIPFDAVKQVVRASVQQFAADLDANPDLVKTLKAA